ncbi:MAG TPA: carbonic anhydrase [Acidimicrobiia bacterium]|nr:carbonic anhydrase [Acidimicrobiia bacterium]
MFDDVLAANRAYVSSFGLAGLEATAARGLAVLTCIDSRIEPLAMLGLEPGDAKILRNAGARVTDDVLRTLVLAVNLLGVERVCVIQHTDCRLSGTSNEHLRANIGRLRGIDAGDWDFLPIDDAEPVLRADMERIRACPLVPSEVSVAGFVYGVDTGRLDPITS